MQSGFRQRLDSYFTPDPPKTQGAEMDFPEKFPKINAETTHSSGTDPYKAPYRVCVPEKTVSWIGVRVSTGTKRIPSERHPHSKESFH